MSMRSFKMPIAHMILSKRQSTACLIQVEDVR
jgi:hypothetical protein